MASDPAIVTVLVEAHLLPYLRDFLVLARKMVPSTATIRDELGGAPNVFHHDGTVWQIKYDGATSVVLPMTGMGYVASLLAAPGVQFNCQQLDQSVRDAGDYEPVVDRETLKAYASRIVELDGVEAGEGLTSELAGERDQLERAIRLAKSLGGRSRPIAREKDRSRTRVSKAIERAICSMEKRNPRLGTHLRKSIRRGLMLVYLPDSPIQWEL